MEKIKKTPRTPRTPRTLRTPKTFWENPGRIWEFHGKNMGIKLI